MGRKSEFDHDEVIEAAMDTFWAQGYTATRIPDLIQTTRLQPGSIYAAFKSKQGLLDASLAHYSQKNLHRIQQCIREAESPLRGLRALMTQIVEDIVNAPQQRGCLLVNTLLELTPQNPAIQNKIDQYLREVEFVLRDTIQAALDLGEINPRYEAHRLARLIMINLWGLHVMAKTQSVNDFSIDTLAPIFDAINNTD